MESPFDQHPYPFFPLQALSLSLSHPLSLSHSVSLSTALARLCLSQSLVSASVRSSSQSLSQPLSLSLTRSLLVIKGLPLSIFVGLRIDLKAKFFQIGLLVVFISGNQKFWLELILKAKERIGLLAVFISESRTSNIESKCTSVHGTEERERESCYCWKLRLKTTQMFYLSRIEHTLRLPPHLLSLRLEDAVRGELEKLFLDKVIANLGLCISVHTIQSINDGFILPNDGHPTFRVYICLPYSSQFYDYKVLWVNYVLFKFRLF
ncbi:uncharacterized protein LOC110771055 [Prunus avium]|uniref:DNA-directed RNA polymerase subunit n=1 Tax=Prunus avium TaxID=42229 RepID=A0A6P5TW20_PRUAV|nr:uncharacterized protein LOC110771055 [Prunus avium]